eukprot:CAMPEP_0194383636 /NCGR_PEP_ID=MMETSP0174-20130528/68548_1 /TAXON_ID=216777 /ORGANISM="Proboscia alata, Strain PI-D3" /LENGTH=577 /DNA_ID=CAMNT_0039170025 /DNA_START=55 /DNA_END=1785 /DNA_ORIENTATION=+
MKDDVENPDPLMSNRLSKDDPFAERESKPLTWTNVKMTVSASKNNPERVILSDVYGEVPPKQVTAIMGPSGAGKTSLLNILAGRSTTRGKVTVESDVRINNVSVNPTKISVRKQIAFVAQDDSLQITSTPREAIFFSAKMRLLRSTTNIELNRLVDRMLEELGLNHCADTLIGGGLVKGISGGERKRTSVGVEIVVKPALVFLDEPTSGLDSFSTVQLIQVLKKVANAGASVLFTIHQPSSEVFRSFDQLILLNRGRVMYGGDAISVPDFFASKGHPVPKNFNPADWIMNIAQTFSETNLNDAGFYSMSSTKTPCDMESDMNGTVTREESDCFADFATESYYLFRRELRGMKRNPASLKVRFVSTICVNLLIGLVFNDVGKLDSSVFKNFQSQFGSIFMVMVQMMFGPALPTLLNFPSERPVFVREFSTNHYSVASYFVSRFTVETVLTFTQVFIGLGISWNLVSYQAPFFSWLPVAYALAMCSTALSVIVGSLVSEAKTATEFLPLIFIPQLLFSGFLVATDLIPVWIRWMRFICPMTYAIGLVLLIEFDDCESGTPCNQMREAAKLTYDSRLMLW